MMKAVPTLFLTFVLGASLFSGSTMHILQDTTISYQSELISFDASANKTRIDKKVNEYVTIKADVTQPQMPTYPVYKTYNPSTDEKVVKTVFFPNEDYELKKYEDGEMEFIGKNTGTNVFGYMPFSYYTNFFYHLSDQDVKKFGKRNLELTTYSKQKALEALEEKVKQLSGMTIDKTNAKFYTIEYQQMPSIWQKLCEDREDFAAMENPTSKMTAEDGGYFIYTKYVTNSTAINDKTIFYDVPSNEVNTSSLDSPAIKAFVNKKGVQYLMGTVLSVSGELEKYDVSKIISLDTALNSFSDYYRLNLNSKRRFLVSSISLQYVVKFDTKNKNGTPDLYPAWAFDGIQTISSRSGKDASHEYSVYIDAITGKYLAFSESPIE